MRFFAGIIGPVDPLALLYQQFDPLRPLEVEETDLYVDWQRQIGPEDIRKRLPLYRQIGARRSEANALLSQDCAACGEAERMYTTIGLVHWAQVAAKEANRISP